MRSVLLGLAALVCVLAIAIYGVGTSSRGTVGDAGSRPGPPVGAGPDLAHLTLRMSLALAAIVLLIVMAAAGLRVLGRRAGMRTASKLEVVDCCHLAPKRALYSVRAGERLVVLGVTETSISLVLELAPDERRALYPASMPETSPTFRSLLKGVTTRIGAT